MCRGCGTRRTRMGMVARASVEVRGEQPAASIGDAATCWLDRTPTRKRAGNVARPAPRGHAAPHVDPGRCQCRAVVTRPSSPVWRENAQRIPFARATSGQFAKMNRDLGVGSGDSLSFGQRSRRVPGTVHGYAGGSDERGSINVLHAAHSRRYQPVQWRPQSSPWVPRFRQPSFHTPGSRACETAAAPAPNGLAVGRSSFQSWIERVTSSGAVERPLAYTLWNRALPSLSRSSWWMCA